MPTIYFTMDVIFTKTRFIIEILFFPFLLTFLVINSNINFVGGFFLGEFCRRCYILAARVIGVRIMH
jgi:hypothetical protein